MAVASSQVCDRRPYQGELHVAGGPLALSHAAVDPSVEAECLPSARKRGR